MWSVLYHPDFAGEVRALPEAVRVELLVAVSKLAQLGPFAGRPLADTLKGSKYQNMKELRFEAKGGVWRVAFAFDPRRKGILLVGGNKTGVSSGRFYAGLLKAAEARYSEHLKSLNEDN